MNRFLISTLALVAISTVAFAHPVLAEVGKAPAPVLQTTPIPPGPPSPTPTNSGTPAPYPSLPPGGPSPTPSP